MSVKIMGVVWDCELPRNEKYVLLAYADHADHNGHNIYPAVSTVARKTGYSERAIQSITGALIDRGVLVIAGTGPAGTNRYRIDLETLYGYVDMGGAEISPPGAEISPRGAKNAPGGVQKNAEGGAESAPDPSVNHQIEPSNRDVEADARAKDVALAASMALLDRWQDLTGAFARTEDERVESIASLNRLWIRCGRDVDKAWRLLRAKRGEMLAENKTPYRPASVVPLIMADLDTPSATAASPPTTPAKQKRGKSDHVQERMARVRALLEET